jgi:hypothetical protein
MAPSVRARVLDRFIDRNLLEKKYHRMERPAVIKYK